MKNARALSTRFRIADIVLLMQKTL